MKLAIVVPIWRRPKVTRIVLDHYMRLSQEAGDEIHLIVVGSEGEALADDIPGGLCLDVPNRPLGAKVNAGIQAARQLAVDGVLMVGSDDIASREYVEAMIEGLDNGFDFQGCLDMFVVDALRGRQLYWPGYFGGRAGEPIGAGRVLSASLLDKLDWRPFDDSLNRGLDGSMTRKLAGLRYNSQFSRMAQLGAITAIKSGDDINGVHKLDGATPKPLITALPDKVIRDAIAPLKRTWSVSLDMIVRGDSTIGLEVALRSAAHLVDEVNILIDRRYGVIPHPQSIAIRNYTKADQVAAWFGANVLPGSAPLFTPEHIHFGNARQVVHDAGSCDWSLIIDADEELIDPGDLFAMIDVAHGAGDVEAVGTILEMYTTKEMVERVTSIRVFRREATGWRYPVHNQPQGVKRMLSSTARIVTSYAGLMPGRIARSQPALEELYSRAKCYGDEEAMEHALHFLLKNAAQSQLHQATVRYFDLLSDQSLADPRRAVVWTWRVEAALRQGDLVLAKGILKQGLEKHPTYDGLLYLSVLFAAKAWAEASLDPVYRHVSSPSRVYLEGLAVAAKALGWPFTLEHE